MLVVRKASAVLKYVKYMFVYLSNGLSFLCLLYLLLVLSSFKMLEQMIDNINVMSDSDEEILYRLQQLRRPKKYKIRTNYLDEYDNQEFLRRFRINKGTFHQLLVQIRDQIQSATNRNNAVTPERKLLLTLRFYATGSMLLVAGDFMGVSEATSCKIIKQVTEAIATLRAIYINMPTTIEDILEIQLKFYQIARFPKVIGAIDCTLVEIESPGGNDAEYFRSRKGWFAWNVQTICDANLQIRDIVARWPGATHDQTIFNNSSIKRQFENSAYKDSVIVGDSGYAVTSYLIPPLPNPIRDEEKLFNESQIRTRNVIERCYGVWKRRFPIMALGMRVSLERSQAIIIATAILHNLAIQKNDEIPPDEPEILHRIREGERGRHRHGQVLEQQIIPPNVRGNNTHRLDLINMYFRNLL